MKAKSRLFAGIFLAVFAGFILINCEDDPGSSITPEEPLPFNDTGAVAFVSNMRTGWNLGNTLDAIGGETAWGNPKTTNANITALKNAGFNLIRIPVSWNNGTGKNYGIGVGWMRRVTEIVNYAVENDMYIILNTHHDEDIFKFRDSDVEASLEAFEKIWKQIADNFQNYDEKLIFEALNEPKEVPVSGRAVLPKNIPT